MTKLQSDLRRNHTNTIMVLLKLGPCLNAQQQSTGVLNAGLVCADCRHMVLWRHVVCDASGCIPL